MYAYMYTSKMVPLIKVKVIFKVNGHWKEHFIEKEISECKVILSRYCLCCSMSCTNENAFFSIYNLRGSSNKLGDFRYNVLKITYMIIIKMAFIVMHATTYPKI